MNRTVIIVRDPKPAKGLRWALITLHWQYGSSVEQWLTRDHSDWQSAWNLIEEGSRSDITESYASLGLDPERLSFRTLAEAKKSWEHYTCAWHNGKVWKFRHELPG